MIWEVGSEFHWDEGALIRQLPGRNALPEKHRLFSTGTGAMRALLCMLGRGRRLHLPSFFCMEVAADLDRSAQLAWYRHVPDGEGPRLESVRATPGDVVLAVNLFGRERQSVWTSWLLDNPNVILVEDHTHDPSSTWAANSSAHYCVASLRKTLPVPDGACLWSPTGAALPPQPAETSGAADLKLTAMVLKAAWLRGLPVEHADVRRLQLAGEDGMRVGEFAASSFTTTVMPLIDAPALRNRRAVNVGRLQALLLDLVTDSAPEGGRRVVAYGDDGSVPYNVQLVMADPPERDALVRHMVGHGVFTPVHWAQDGAPVASGDKYALELSRRILTVPCDFRYGSRDIDRVFTLLEAFLTERRGQGRRDEVPAATLRA